VAGAYYIYAGDSYATRRVGKAKKKGELQPEFQAMMDQFRGELLQMQNAQKRGLLRYYFKKISLFYRPPEKITSIAGFLWQKSQ